MKSEKTLNIREDFFEQPFVTKLRTLEDGEKYVLIYLKLQSISAENNGEIFCKKTDASFTQELASKIDEEVKDVEMAISLFERYNLIKFKGKEGFTFCPTPVIRYE